MRVREQVRKALGPLILTLSQGEMGPGGMAKKVPWFCTTHTLASARDDADLDPWGLLP